jgi:hypothetical protein
VLAVCRSSVTSLAAARRFAAGWAEGGLGGMTLWGLVVVADAPGALPKVLWDLVRLTKGGFPRVWRVPWVEAWRRGVAPAEHAPPEVRRLGRDLTVLARADVARSPLRKGKKR